MNISFVNIPAVAIFVLTMSSCRPHITQSHPAAYIECPYNKKPVDAGWSHISVSMRTSNNMMFCFTTLGLGGDDRKMAPEEFLSALRFMRAKPHEMNINLVIRVENDSALPEVVALGDNLMRESLVDKIKYVMVTTDAPPEYIAGPVVREIDFGPAKSIEWYNANWYLQDK